MISINVIIFVIICFAKFTNPIRDVMDIRRISALRIAGSGGSSSSSCFWRGGWMWPSHRCCLQLTFKVCNGMSKEPNQISRC